MKIGILGDVHARMRPPGGRVEKDWFSLFKAKFSEAMGIFEENDCGVIIQPGDLFDSPSPSNEVTHFIIKLIKRANLFGGQEFFTVLGQHDVHFHNVDFPNKTTTGILEAAGCVTILNNKPVSALAPEFSNIHFYGASWGIDPPKLKPGDTGGVNVLVAHAHVGNVPLFPGHVLATPSQYARKNKDFDLICLGDYHYPYNSTVKWRGVSRVPQTFVINAGCMFRMRNTEREQKHIPSVIIFDTDTGIAHKHILESAPKGDVFVSTENNNNVSDHPALDEFIAGLSKHNDDLFGDGKNPLSFHVRLETILDKENASKEVREEVSKILKEVGAK